MLTDDDVPCKSHPDAPHGFCRDASHSLDRYVCECEFWEPPMTDPIVDSVVHQFKKRSEIGIYKYGTTLYENPLELSEWIQHLKEELMDAVLYLERIKFKLDGE